MPANYTGVPANVTASASPVVSIPADGDADNAATFAAAFQKLTDFVANIFKFILQGPINVVSSVTNTAAITATGNGSASAVIGIGGGGGIASSGVEGTASGTGAGVKGTGVVGVQGIATSGGTAVQCQGSNVANAHGALALGVQNSIGSSSTSLQPGELFFDGTNLRLCKVAGSSVIVI